MDGFFSYIHSLRPGDRLVFVCACIAFIIASLVGIITINKEFLVDVPLRGSVFTEGFLGAPRFVNPVLAMTQTDKDLTALVYAGLLCVGESGDLVPDLAESVTRSDDGLQYHITIRTDSTWSDGTPLTAEDVAFTIRALQDPLIASPYRTLFENVTVETVGTYELNLVLSSPNTTFMEVLTFGIMPAHVWSGVPADRLPYDMHNTMPIGAGAYTVAEIVAAKDGGPEEYILTPNTYAHTVPKLTLYARFYTNDNQRLAALRAGEIDAAAGVDASLVADIDALAPTYTIVTRVLPRTFALFFNQNKSTALRDQAAREALNIVLNRQVLVTDVLHGFGTVTRDPVPDVFAPARAATSEDESTALERARDRLERGGWKFSAERNAWEKKIAGATTTLAVTVATLNTPVFTETAAQVQAQFATLNVPLTIKTYERADMTNTIIRNRDYEALLYGTATGRTLDLYPFWHSSRRADPGLNIAMYTNITADAALADLRDATSTAARTAAYTALTDTLHAEVPALFLYSPEFVYIVKNDILMSIPEKILDQTERFATAATWHRETEAVWNIFK